MRSVVSRLARLEQLNRLRKGPQRIRIERGYLKTLPVDFTGPRHVVTVRQMPPEEIAPTERADNWFEWEERLGPEPASNATGPDDEILVKVSYVAAKPKA